MGDPGDLLDQLNPLYVQFLKMHSILNPSGIFVFLDEHCDTINDGFFVNRLQDYQWGNMPGSYHDGGLSLSFADGHILEDADWRTTTDGKHYRVRVPLSADGTQMDWIDVPDEAVITEPNRAGHTMVWPLYGNGGVSIRCFMPGSMT